MAITFTASLAPNTQRLKYEFFRSQQLACQYYAWLPNSSRKGLVLIRGPKRNKITNSWASLSHQIVGWCPMSYSEYAEMWRHHTWGWTSNKPIHWMQRVGDALDMSHSCPNVTRQNTANQFVAAIADSDLDPHNGLACMLTILSKRFASWYLVHDGSSITFLWAATVKQWYDIWCSKPEDFCSFFFWSRGRLTV